MPSLHWTIKLDCVGNGFIRSAFFYIKNGGSKPPTVRSIIHFSLIIYCVPDEEESVLPL